MNRRSFLGTIPAALAASRLPVTPTPVEPLQPDVVGDGADCLIYGWAADEFEYRTNVKDIVTYRPMLGDCVTIAGDPHLITGCTVIASSD